MSAFESIRVDQGCGFDGTYTSPMGFHPQHPTGPARVLPQQSQAPVVFHWVKFLQPDVIPKPYLGPCRPSLGQHLWPLVNETIAMSLLSPQEKWGSEPWIPSSVLSWKSDLCKMDLVAPQSLTILPHPVLFPVMYVDAKCWPQFLNCLGAPANCPQKSISIPKRGKLGFWNLGSPWGMRDCLATLWVNCDHSIIPLGLWCQDASPLWGFEPPTLS